MVNYANGKIYKIVCNTTGLQYIGSTTKKTLAERLSAHIWDYKSYKNGKRTFITSFKTLENNNYEIILIEEFPCETKDQLHARERYYIETLVCVNKYIPNRTDKEYQKDNKTQKLEYMKQYGQANKEKIAEYQKQYYDNHRETEKEYRKQYYIANKDKLYENLKLYRLKKKQEKNNSL